MPDKLDAPDHAHDPIAVRKLRRAVELVGLDERRVLMQGASIELNTANRAGAVLTVRVLLDETQTAQVLDA